MKIFLGIIAVFIIIAVLAAIELWTQPKRYEAFWQRQNTQKPQSGELLYVALGDSTAQGIGAGHPQKGYVGLVAKELGQRTGKPVRIVNLSKYGARINDAISQQLPLLEKLDITNESVVTIEIGANDMGSFEAGKFETEMNELMAKLPKQTVISDMPYFGGGLRKNLEPNVVKANVIIRKLAEKHGLKVADLHQYTARDNWFQNYAIDRFHPSGHSYKTLWAPAFLEKL